MEQVRVGMDPAPVHEFLQGGFGEPFYVHGENPFSGKTVVVTGTLENFTRAGIQARIKELGGRAAGSVSKKTDFVLAHYFSNKP